MSKITQNLKKIGLTETEADIYLTGLSFPAVSAAEIAKQTGIKRPTVYHALETLMQKGLAAKRGTGNRLAFTMTDPENIKKLVDQQIDQMKEQKKSLDELIPLIAGRAKADASQVEVIQYDGIEGIKLVVEEALYCRSRKWDIIAPRKNFFYEFESDYAKYFMGTRKARGITTRSLWERHEGGAKKTPGGYTPSESVMRERNPRFLPPTLTDKFRSVVIIFDDKVAIIPSYKNLSAILIKSTEIQETMSAIFEGLWLAAEE